MHAVRLANPKSITISDNECNSFFEGLRPCVNGEGSYTCGDCLDGYVEDGSSGFCLDVDECAVPERIYCGADSATCSVARCTTVHYDWVDAARGGGVAEQVRPGEEFAMDL